MSFEDDRGNVEVARRRFRASTFWVVAIVVVVCGWTLFLLTASRGRNGVLGQVRAIQEQSPNEALQLLEQALADAGGADPDAQVMKCEILGALQGWRAAEQYFDTIESPQASDQKVLIDLAVAANQGQAAWLAAKVLTVANHPGPDRERVVRLLLGVKYELGEMEAVLKLCKELAELAPLDPEPWLVSAGIYHEVEAFSPALTAYQKALERSPSEQESLRVRLHIVEVSLHLGDLKSAEQHIEILRNLNPTSPSTNLAYAKLLRRKGLDAQARAVVEVVVAKEPQFQGGLMLRGMLNFDDGDFRAAAADFRAAVLMNPFDHNAHYKLGQALQQLGTLEEAERHFERSRSLMEAVSQLLFLGRQLDQDPTNREVRLKLAEQHLLLGDALSAEHWRRTAEGLR